MDDIEETRDIEKLLGKAKKEKRFMKMPYG